MSLLGVLEVDVGADFDAEIAEEELDEEREEDKLKGLTEDDTVGCIVENGVLLLVSVNIDGFIVIV